jgi:hypothetical protein
MGVMGSCPNRCVSAVVPAYGFEYELGAPGSPA